MRTSKLSFREIGLIAGTRGILGRWVGFVVVGQNRQHTAQTTSGLGAACGRWVKHDSDIDACAEKNEHASTESPSLVPI